VAAAASGSSGGSKRKADTGGSDVAGRGGVGATSEAREAGAWQAFVEAHLDTFDVCVAELPGLDRSRAQQMARLAVLQAELAAKQAELAHALTVAKAQSAEHRWATVKGRSQAEDGRE
jgi:hypothetical protein